jgi:hypothetical protein
MKTGIFRTKHFRNLSEPGKDWKGNKLTRQDFPPGTIVVLSDGGGI